MGKKSILMLLVIIILVVIVGGVFAYNQFIDSNTQVKVGSSTFNLPNGFHTVDSSKSDVFNITNGYDTIYLKEAGNKNITKYVKTYTKNMKEDNKTVKTKNFTVDNVVVYKATVVNNTHNIHYWFDYNGTVYACYTHNGNDNTDDIITNLIKSN